MEKHLNDTLLWHISKNGTPMLLRILIKEWNNYQRIETKPIKKYILYYNPKEESRQLSESWPN